MLWIVTVVLVTLVIRYMPCRRIILGEGVFNDSRIEFNFRSGKEDRVFWFRYPCKYCWTHGRSESDKVFRDECPVVMPKNARSTSAAPRPGESVVLIGYVNVFSRVIAYRSLVSGFKNEFMNRERIEPGREFRLRECMIGILKTRYARMERRTDKTASCPDLHEVIEAEKRGWNSKLGPYGGLSPIRQVHAESCNWCRTLLCLDLIDRTLGRNSE